MERKVGTVSRGIRCPIIRQGDDLANIVVTSVLEAAEQEGFQLRDQDVIAVTESIVARAQGNYVSVDDIAADVRAKFGTGAIGVILPILSRNRFAICLRGIAKGADKIVLMLSYPSDEVGNGLVTLDQLDEAGVNPYSDVLTLERYRELFGENKHPFTGVDYIQYYSDLIRDCGAEVEVILANDPRAVLPYSGCNEQYGLLGSNKSNEDTVKLFPRACQGLVEDIQAQVLAKTGAHVEVMVYGDGAFKDPVGKIWELADPCVGVAYTAGLEGTPNELKLKYLADNDFKDLSGEALKEAISDRIKSKASNLVGDMAAQGTTPRRLTDLIGSLCDLTSGSGDKGTPVILVQGYFDNFTN